MVCRVYLDEYYSDLTRWGPRHRVNLKEAEADLVEFLHANFPGEWKFGLTTLISDVKRCIYFDNDEVATLFILKSGIQARVVRER